MRRERLREVRASRSDARARACSACSLIARSREVQSATIFSTRTGAPCATSKREDLLDVVLHLVQVALHRDRPAPAKTRVRAACAT